MTTTERAEKHRPTVYTEPGIRFPPLLRGVGLKTIWDERRSILWWSVGAAVLSAIVVLLFPSIEGGAELEELIERLPPAVRALMGEHIDLATAHGYLNLRLFTFIAPIIFLAYSIGRGTAAIAGEEDRGTMDLLLAHPVARWRIVSEKFGAMVFGLVVIGLGLWIGIVVGAIAVSVELDFSHAAQATLMGVFLAMFHGALALAFGSGTGRSGRATGISAGVAIGGYFLHTLAPLIDWLEPVQIVSPFYYYIEDPAMLQGLIPGHAIVLIVASLILLAIAVLTFQRRDVQV